MSSEFDPEAEERKEKAVASICTYFGIKSGEVLALIGILFTSGTDEYVLWDDDEVQEMPVDEIEGFEELSGLSGVKGHKLVLFLRKLGGKMIWGLKGRIHLYQATVEPYVVRPMVRLQFDMLTGLGIKVLINTSAVGSCVETLRIGQTVVCTNMLRWGNDSLTGIGADGFPMLEGGLHSELQAIAIDSALPFHAVPGTHFYWHGSDIEGAKVKQMVRLLGGDFIGMSGQPGIEAAHRQGVWVLFLGYVTNADEHDENTVGDAAAHYGPIWMGALKKTVAAIPGKLGKHKPKKKKRSSDLLEDLFDRVTVR